LRLGSGTIDFIREEEICEDRALDETAHLATCGGVFLDEVAAGDIAGHEVGGELDAMKLQVEHTREGRGHECLAHAGHAEEQDVAFTQQRQQEQLERFFLAYDDFANLGIESFAGLEEMGGDIGGHGGWMGVLGKNQRSGTGTGLAMRSPTWPAAVASVGVRRVAVRPLPWAASEGLSIWRKFRSL
jgi:hypothetical protein